MPFDKFIQFFEQHNEPGAQQLISNKAIKYFGPDSKITVLPRARISKEKARQQVQ